jgi:hypothetical protein
MLAFIRAARVQNEMVSARALLVALPRVSWLVYRASEFRRALERAASCTTKQEGHRSRRSGRAGRRRMAGPGVSLKTPPNRECQNTIVDEATMDVLGAALNGAGFGLDRYVVGSEAPAIRATSIQTKECGPATYLEQHIRGRRICKVKGQAIVSCNQRIPTDFKLARKTPNA